MGSCTLRLEGAACTIRNKTSMLHKLIDKIGQWIKNELDDIGHVYKCRTSEGSPGSTSLTNFQVRPSSSLRAIDKGYLLAPFRLLNTKMRDPLRRINAYTLPPEATTDKSSKGNVEDPALLFSAVGSTGNASYKMIHTMHEVPV